KHARGYSDAGRDHRSPDEDGFSHGISAQMHVAESENEWEDDAGDGDEQGLWPYANQVSGAGFKACVKQHEDRANLGDRLGKTGGMDPAESKWTDERTRKNFSQHRRKLEALEKFSDHLGGKEDYEQLEEKLLRAVLHGIGG